MKHDILYIPEWKLDGPVLLALPHEHSDWNNILSEALDQYRRLIMALIEGGEEVWLLVNNISESQDFLAQISHERIKIIETPINDTWTRDYGPIAVHRYDRMRLLDFAFNGWGLKFASDHDNLVNFNLNNKGLFMPVARRNHLDFTLEGGSIETDGQGTLLTTSRCLLSLNRNGGDKKKISEVLVSTLGVEHILWLDYGSLIGDDTDSHIDTLCRMAPDNVILFTGCRNLEDPHFEELLKMRAQLTCFRNMEGEPFNLVELPLPDPVHDENGNRLPATYANYLVTPRAVYMPVYGHTTNDNLACQSVKIAFPEHKVIPVECTTLTKQHGSLHCSTMTIPRSAVNQINPN